MTIADILTKEELLLVQELRTTNPSYGFAKAVADKIITPNLDRIEATIGQPMDAIYLAYLIQHFFLEPTEDRIKSLAMDLAKAVDNLNPACREIGAGYMAEMKQKAEAILALGKPKEYVVLLNGAPVHVAGSMTLAQAFIKESLQCNPLTLRIQYGIEPYKN